VLVLEYDTVSLGKRLEGFFTVKMEALRSFETSRTTYPTTQRNISEDSNLRQHRAFRSSDIAF